MFMIRVLTIIYSIGICCAADYQVELVKDQLARSIDVLLRQHQNDWEDILHNCSGKVMNAKDNTIRSYIEEKSNILYNDLKDIYNDDHREINPLMELFLMDQLDSLIYHYPGNRGWTGVPIERRMIQQYLAYGSKMSLSFPNYLNDFDKQEREIACIGVYKFLENRKKSEEEAERKRNAVFIPPAPPPPPPPLSIIGGALQSTALRLKKTTQRAIVKQNDAQDSLIKELKERQAKRALQQRSIMAARAWEQIDPIPGVEAITLKKVERIPSSSAIEIPKVVAAKEPSVMDDIIDLARQRGLTTVEEETIFDLDWDE